MRISFVNQHFWSGFQTRIIYSDIVPRLLNALCYFIRFNLFTVSLINKKTDIGLLLHLFELNRMDVICRAEIMLYINHYLPSLSKDVT